MATLGPQIVTGSYGNLLKFLPIGEAGVTTSQVQITDGKGKVTPLQLATGSVYVSGTLSSSAEVVFSGLTPNAPGQYVSFDTTTGRLYYSNTSSIQNVVSASYAVTASYALNGGGGVDNDWTVGTTFMTASGQNNVYIPGKLEQGNNTEASGFASTAMGNGTEASGDWSTAMGNNTTARMEGSTAFGKATTAKGGYSHTFGVYTLSYQTAQTVVGIYNSDSDILRPEQDIFIVGTGKNSGRKDAFKVRADTDEVILLKQSPINGNNGAGLYFGEPGEDKSFRIVAGTNSSNSNQLQIDICSNGIYSPTQTSSPNVTAVFN